jgi:serine/threonine protein kinase
VYRAHDPRLDRQAAIKVLSPEIAADIRARERFRREAKAAAALDHPYICKVFEIAEHDGTMFLVMEYIAGETLYSRLLNGPMPLEDILRFGGEIAEALQEAHIRGFLHRDLKPANIMLTAQGHVKIMDFGLAKRFADGLPAHGSTSPAERGSELTLTGTVLGTPDYMSPEQARGEELDVRTDLFSFGCVLYEMATGRRAFSGATTALVFDSILHADPTSPLLLNGKLPSKLDDIINKALEKDRELRYQHAVEMRADLRRLSRDTSSEPRGRRDSIWASPGRPKPTARPDRPRARWASTPLGTSRRHSAYARRGLGFCVVRYESLLPVPAIEAAQAHGQSCR